MKKAILTGIAALFLLPGTAHAENNPHFYPKVTIGGIPIRMMADTGATNVALSFDDARRIGLNPDTLPKNGLVDTANGTRSTSIFVLSEITVEGFVLHSITASCCVTGESLLGMSALSRLEITFRKGWMMLNAPTKDEQKPPESCHMTGYITSKNGLCMQPWWPD
jgi:clan AA aspartic protease (TIGR02281 family)